MTHLQSLTMCLWSLFHRRDKESGAMLSTTTNRETKVRWTRMISCQSPVKAYGSHSALITAPPTTVRCADRRWRWIVWNQGTVLHLLMRRNHHSVKKIHHQVQQQFYCVLMFLSVWGWWLMQWSNHFQNGSSTHAGSSLGVNHMEFPASQLYFLLVVLLHERSFTSTCALYLYGIAYRYRGHISFYCIGDFSSCAVLK